MLAEAAERRCLTPRLGDVHFRPRELSPNVAANRKWRGLNSRPLGLPGGRDARRCLAPDQQRTLQRETLQGTTEMRIRQGASRPSRTGSCGALPGHLVPELRRVLTLLDQARHPGDLAQAGYRLHPLKATGAGLWGIRVSGGRRVLSRFEFNEAVDVDLTHYH